MPDASLDGHAASAPPGVEPHGVAVYLEAHHLCTQIRGVRESGPKMRTTAYRGIYTARPDLRSEFFDATGLCRGDR